MLQVAPATKSFILEDTDREPVRILVYYDCDLADFVRIDNVGEDKYGTKVTLMYH